MKQDELEKEYYSFANYVSLDRFNTYWFQVNEIMGLRPRNAVEIGVGTGVVKYLVEGLGVPVTTIDINENLKPDVVASITAPGDALKDKAFDLVICSRVFHHIPFSDVENALDTIAGLSRKHAVLVLAAEDFRLYFSARLTSARAKFFSVPIPLSLKRLIIKTMGRGASYYYNIWKLNSSAATQRRKVEALISAKFEILKSYPIPTNHGHYMYVLEKKG